MLKWFIKKFPFFLLIFYLFAQLGYWWFDRNPPIKITGIQKTTRAIIGEEVKIEIPVKRDIKRNCSVLFSRYLIDSNGTYYDIMATRFLSYDGWVNMNRVNPDSIKFATEIPRKASLGPAILITQNAYMCNPLQYIWPIDVDIKTELEIENSL